MDVYVRNNVEARGDSSNEMYGDWRVSNESYNYEVALTKDYLASQETAPFDVEEGDIVYLVIVSYDTGNSFGRETNKHVLVDIFKTEGKAYDVSRKISQKPICKNFSFSYHNENGELVKIYTPWVGYFEKFRYAEVIGVIVQKEFFDS